ncbi:MAG: SDR family NAD(P)-dependent oxidoreductase [Flavobacteriaceae bacterium]
MTGQLSGKVAIVTGGASGIGLATVTDLTQAGADVAILDRNAEQARKAAVQAAADTGRRVEVFACDLAATQTLGAIVDDIAARFGRIDILVNSAGMTDHANSLINFDAAQFDLVQRLNLMAPLELVRHAARHMIAQGQGGRIVNVSSSSAHRAIFTFPGYAMSKAALEQLTRTAAWELGPHDINVNTVAPGVTETPLALGSLPDRSALDRAASEGPLANLLKRISQPEDVSGVITFLCLPASRQITGQTVHTSAGSVV